MRHPAAEASAKNGPRLGLFSFFVSQICPKNRKQNQILSFGSKYSESLERRP